MVVTDASLIEVNHTRLYCEQTGEGTPVIFIHGFSLDRRMWDDQMPVAAKGFRIIRYDLRGFGLSQVPHEDGAYTHHDDLASLMDKLGIQKAFLVGLSLGGRVATGFALQFPDRVLGLVLANSVLEGYAMKDYKMDYIYKAAREEGIPKAIQLWLDHPTFSASRKHPSTDKKLKTIVKEYSGWHFTNKNPMIPLKPPCIERLHDIQVPTLVLFGENDLPDMQDISKLLDESIPNAELTRIPDAGHMSNMDQSRRFNKALLEFFKRYQ
jgi:pimeloyl-ACP methyl ester carboxylesterase